MISGHQLYIDYQLVHIFVPSTCSFIPTSRSSYWSVPEYSTFLPIFLLYHLLPNSICSCHLSQFDSVPFLLMIPLLICLVHLRLPKLNNAHFWALTPFLNLKVVDRFNSTNGSCMFQISFRIGVFSTNIALIVRCLNPLNCNSSFFL